MADEKYPLRIRYSAPVSQSALAGGSLLTLLAIAGAGMAFYWLPRLIEAQRGESPSSEPSLYLLGFVGSLCLLYFLIAGLGEAIAGARRLLQPVVDSEGPQPFLDFHSEVMPALRDGKLQFFGTISARLRVLFGQNIVSLGPTACSAVVNNGNALIRRALTIPLLGLTVFLAIAYEWPSQILIPLGLLIVGSFCQGAAEYFSAVGLVPGAPRTARSDRDSHHYQGFGHPTHLFTRIPILLAKLALPGFQNRFYRWGEQEKAGTVRDVGEFTGAVFIERQPTVIEGKNSRSGIALLLAGWSLRIAAAGIVVFLLTPFASGLHQNLMAILLMILATLRFYSKGSRFKKQGIALLETLQFRSVAILLAVTGEMSRADVHVGRGREDSLSSQNVAARSNFTAQFCAGELISESATVEERRRLVQVSPTPESRVWLDTLKSEIGTLRDERIRPVGVDLESEEAGEVIRANEAILARRALLPGKSEARDFVHATPVGSRQLGEAAEEYREYPVRPGSGTEETELKICPECAEKIRAQAKKCRFCGWRFEDSETTR